MINKTGIPTMENIKSVFPDEERINKGPVAVIECFQNIPCNPCSTACKRNAIMEMNDINNIPNINVENCNGCGLCVSVCPGLAIMVIDGSYSDEELLFRIPFEFLPLPKEGDIVKGLNRAGEYITDVSVVKVLNPPSFDKTPIISVAVPREFLYDFRNIKVEEV